MNADTTHTPAWAPGTRCYLSGYSVRSVRVEDPAKERGGLEPLDYATPEGILPPFDDGTPARYGECQRCGMRAPVMHVQPFKPLRARRWLCIECCPVGALPQ